jgi:Subtilase family/PAP2 superfamily
MSKSKSKSKSKSPEFPTRSWDPSFEIYTYLGKLNDYYKEIFEIELDEPAREGDALAGELSYLLALQANRNERERREPDILFEAGEISDKYQNALLISPETHPRTWQLMNVMSDVALVPVMHYKRKFMRARPNQMEPRIEPLIPVPGHPAYPSGHATQNFLIAHALSEVIGDDAELIARVFAIARGVAENREWAGVHYQSDTRAGEKLAADLFPTFRKIFAEMIEAAVREWQEIPVAPVARPQPLSGVHAAMQQSQKAPLPGSRFFEQWHLQNRGEGGVSVSRAGVDINVLDAWQELKIWQDYQPGGTTVRPPVRALLLDMAVQLRHPALIGVLDHASARNLDSDVPNPGTKAIGGDEWNSYVEAFGSASSAHGTACAGVIAASMYKDGCLGIAPTCQVVPYRAMTLTEPTLEKRQKLARTLLRIFKEGFGREERVADLVLLPLPLEPLEPVPAGGDPLALALAFVATKIPVILPSGNNGTSRLSYPADPDRLQRHIGEPKSFEALIELLGLSEEDLASMPWLRSIEGFRRLWHRMHEECGFITVGACNCKGYRSRYSQYGHGLTLSAPSDDVLEPRDDPRLGWLSIATTDVQGLGGYSQGDGLFTSSTDEFGFGGTSAAAAQVAGVVALMLNANPDLRPDEVQQILRETARTTYLRMDDGKEPSPGSNEFGAGLVDAAAAVEDAKQRRAVTHSNKQAGSKAA